MFRQKNEKFKRRSMSPVNYLNTSTYKQKIKKNDLKFDFSFLNSKKLDKINVLKLNISFHKEGRAKGEHQLRDRSEQIKNGERERLKKMDESRKKIQIKQVNQSERDPDESIILEDCSGIFKTDLYAQNDLQTAMLRKLQLEKQLEVKTKKVDLLREQLSKQESSYQNQLGREKQLKSELQKLQIQLMMQQRKGSDSMVQIRQLQSQVQKERDRIKSISRRSDLFELSPDKCQFELDDKFQ